jgi:hypothetical protein
VEAAKIKEKCQLPNLLFLQGALSVLEYLWYVELGVADLRCQIHRGLLVDGL